MFDYASNYVEVRKKINDVFHEILQKSTFYSSGEAVREFNKLIDDVLLVVDSYGSRNGYIGKSLHRLSKVGAALEKTSNEDIPIEKIKIKGIHNNE